MVLYLLPTVSIGGLISLFDDPNILHAARIETEQLRCSCKGFVRVTFLEELFWT